MVDHLKEFMICLSSHNDIEEGRIYRQRDIFKGSDFTDDIELFVQVYGDYVARRIEAVFRDDHPVFAFVRPLTESANGQVMSLLHFTTRALINDQRYEVVLCKQEFMDGKLAKSKTDFNKRTRELIISIVTRMMNLGKEPNDRQVAIPLTM